MIFENDIWMKVFTAQDDLDIFKILLEAMTLSNNITAKGNNNLTAGSIGTTLNTVTESMITLQVSSEPGNLPLLSNSILQEKKGMITPKRVSHPNLSSLVTLEQHLLRECIILEHSLYYLLPYAFINTSSTANNNKVSPLIPLTHAMIISPTESSSTFDIQLIHSFITKLHSPSDGSSSSSYSLSTILSQLQNDYLRYKIQWMNFIPKFSSNRVKVAMR